jgi:hypothetical protein
MLAFVAASLPFAAPAPARRSSLVPDSLPSLVLWAWERPEDLRTLDADVGVAFLAQTISVRDDGFSVDPRRQPLRVAPSAHLVAVTRIEAGPLSRLLSTDDAGQVALLIARTARLPQVVGVQIDFDATLSQRRFYRELADDLRSRLGPHTPISVTALASWCVDDRWLRVLPVDEIVPALFRMGPTNQVFRDVGASGDWTAEECRSAVGTSLDEPLVLQPRKRRVYVFTPKPWTVASIVQARRLAR